MGGALWPGFLFMYVDYGCQYLFSLRIERLAPFDFRDACFKFLFEILYPCQKTFYYRRITATCLMFPSERHPFVRPSAHGPPVPAPQHHRYPNGWGIMYLGRGSADELPPDVTFTKPAAEAPPTDLEKEGAK